ncbi:MAG: hypothetical protein LLF94_07585, partial [Chlamydiales bacterium]|nr:hypothetical protein [Chlamydiales bacterium]
LPIYKECYKLFVSFANELQLRLDKFLEFPFHKMMDEPLADIAYQLSKEKQIMQPAPIDQISSETVAIGQYRLFKPKLDSLSQFMTSFKKRLEELYFFETKKHLLTSSDTLFKRRLVHNLFSVL